MNNFTIFIIDRKNHYKKNTTKTKSVIHYLPIQDTENYIIIKITFKFNNLFS